MKRSLKSIWQLPTNKESQWGKQQWKNLLSRNLSWSPRSCVHCRRCQPAVTATSVSASLPIHHKVTSFAGQSSKQDRTFQVLYSKCSLHIFSSPFTVFNTTQAHKSKKRKKKKKYIHSVWALCASWCLFLDLNALPHYSSRAQKDQAKLAHFSLLQHDLLWGSNGPEWTVVITALPSDHHPWLH